MILHVTIAPLFDMILPMTYWTGIDENSTTLLNFGLAHEEQFRLHQRLRQFHACFEWFDCFELSVVAVPVSVAWNVFVSAVFSVLVVVVFAMWAAVVVDSVTVVVTEVA